MKRPLSIRIDLDSPVPTYRQIVDALRAHLVEGQLAAGDVLPSVRRLALELASTSTPWLRPIANWPKKAGSI